MPLWMNWLDDKSGIAVTIISIALMLACGFLMTRITKKLRLPNVTAYIVGGILAGPYCLNLIPQKVIEGSSFLPDIALAFIAFSTGEFFRLSSLRKNGGKVVTITVMESVGAAVLVFLTCHFILGLNFAFSVVLGALATATAPASTIMTIRQTGAKGDFVETLLQVVALDDVVGLILYSMAISVATAVFSSTGFHISHVLLPIGKNLLGCMAMGMVYINTSEDERLFRQLNYFSPPILLLFFFRSGLSFDLGLLVGSSEAIGSVSLLGIGMIYFFVRIIGKYIGAWSGCRLAGKPQKVCRYLGLALIPQAGVAIGLAALGARELGGEMGRALETIILSSSVLYELIGPGAAKLSLWLSGSYSSELEEMAPVQETAEDGRKKSEVELLIERIQKIQSELPAHTENENERAFTEAAEEYHRNQNLPAPRRTPRRRLI